MPSFELDPTGLAFLVLLPLVIAAVLVLVFSVAAVVVVEVLVVLVAAYLWRGRWIIEASTEGPPAEREEWIVRGWRRNRRFAAQIAESL